MDDPNTIMTLCAADKYGMAADAFRLPHNRDRYVRPAAFMDDGPSRETTPSDSGNDGTPVIGLEYFHRIRLTFDQKPKVPGRFTFGSDPNCDVLLTSRRGQHFISGLHFYISFDAQRRIILEDVSTNGTTISYEGQVKVQRRRRFRWILFDRFKKINVKLRKEGPAFDIHLPNRNETCWDEYEENVNRWMADARDTLPAFDNLAFRSHDTSLGPSETYSPRQRPIYLKDGELGRGVFGLVRKVVDVSTGFEYAGKEFFHKEGWEQEVKVMRNLHHEHIVEFVDFNTETKPLLVMEYLPLGNLEDQHADSLILEEEMMALMHQCLMALEYLHACNVTHRDVKPANILVSSRTPFNVKLADFGLSQDKSILQTFCGSLVYGAPEIFQNRLYSNAVDIWSLAVVVMQFVYGLPENKEQGNVNPSRSQSLSWCQCLIKAADDWDSDLLIGFLTDYMLKWDPHNRIPAADCLRQGSEIGLFNGAFSKTGNTTPRLRPDQSTDNINAEDARTIIMDPVWGNNNVSLQEKRTFRSRQTSCEQAESSHAKMEASHDGQSTSLVSQEPCDNRSAKRRRTVSDSHPPTPSGELLQRPVDVLPPMVIEEPKGYLKLAVRGMYVLMRKTDGWLNATQIVKLAGKSENERYGIFNWMRRHTTIETRATMKAQDDPRARDPEIVPTDAWVNFNDGLLLCQYLGLEDDMKPILENGGKGRATYEMHFTVAGYHLIPFGSETIAVRTSDLRISAVNIIKIAGKDYGALNKVKKDWNLEFDVSRGKNVPLGTYIDFDDGLRLCQHFGLEELRKHLSEWRQTQQQQPSTGEMALPPDHLKDQPSCYTEPSEKICQGPAGYSKLTIRGKDVYMRMIDYWLNATQIVALAGRSSAKRDQIFQRLGRHTIVETSATNAAMKPEINTWVSFFDGLLLCQFLGLEDDLKPLLEIGKSKCEVPTTYKNYFVVEDYDEIPFYSKTIAIRKIDLHINAVNITRIAGKDYKELSKAKKDLDLKCDIVPAGQNGPPGSYVAFDDGLRLCQHWGLEKLSKHLSDWREKQQRESYLSPRDDGGLSTMKLYVESPPESPMRPTGESTSAKAGQTAEVGLSYYTEPSFRYGSFLPMMKGSCLDSTD